MVGSQKLSNLQNNKRQSTKVDWLKWARMCFTQALWLEDSLSFSLDSSTASLDAVSQGVEMRDELKQNIKYVIEGSMTDLRTAFCNASDSVQKKVH